MRAKSKSNVSGAALVALTALAFGGAAFAASDGGPVALIGPQDLAKIVPGQSTKTDIASLLGAPWRVVQFNDCGMAMDGQADETWEYRETDANGSFRLHVEFGDDNVVHLVAKVPDNSPGGQATAAKVAPAASMNGMSM